MAVRWSGAAPGSRVLDVCCGSGDLTFRAAEAAGPSGEVVGLDFAAEMLADAAHREEVSQHRRRKSAPISWVQGDAMELPFEDGSFDAATMGYGLRNVTDKQQALAELHRVLRPGCRVAILDFNNARARPAVAAFQGWCLDNVVVPVAHWKGVGPEYEYLRPSIQQFATGPEQEALALAAGFIKAVHYETGLGLMGVLVAQA
ncbi:hypothetical protein WJX81_006187 [Elliptochloris bilobata]|uniref:2-phytyl-1,4-beta-naphthoquinone methyltransferase, chloroplastic n=1 Tax=Elliptochloris bilobata TaxID=381761 RepID=A0AAW1RTM5_9CHLO